MPFEADTSLKILNEKALSAATFSLCMELKTIGSAGSGFSTDSHGSGSGFVPDSFFAHEAYPKNRDTKIR